MPSSFTPAMGATLTLGIDHYTQDVSNLYTSQALNTSGTILTPPSGALNESLNTITNTGYFVQSQVSAWSVLFLTAGVRAEKNTTFGADYGTAVLRSATVPFGWIIGCPLLGLISDRLGRRKPVLLVSAVLLLNCMAWILFGPSNVLPPYIPGLFAGIVSGAAMLPYTIIKEANPPQFGGTATGVVNFLNFTFSALLGPLFGWSLQQVSGGASQLELPHFQRAFQPMLIGVLIAIVLCFFLRETGPAAKEEVNPE